MALGLLSAIIFTGLWLVTPPASNAPSLARALAQTHRAPYPGPPVPRQFIVALVAADPLATTLYQQLAKTLYTPWRSSFTAKAEQIILGIKLAFALPSTEILQMYSDVAYFGQNYYGLHEASCGYFGVPPARLTWAQAAMLAGIVPAPSAGNPITHFAVARARQAHVLQLLVTAGRLTAAQASKAGRQPLHLRHGRHARSFGCRSAVRRP